MRLSDGTLFPIPVTLDAPQAAAEKLTVHQRISLQDTEGNLIAIMTVESIYKPDKETEAKCVFGSTDEVNFILTFNLI
jgi:sulfate adenylyltransferase